MAELGAKDNKDYRDRCLSRRTKAGHNIPTEDGSAPLEHISVHTWDQCKRDRSQRSNHRHVEILPHFGLDLLPPCLLHFWLGNFQLVAGLASVDHGRCVIHLTICQMMAFVVVSRSKKFERVAPFKQRRKNRVAKDVGHPIVLKARPTDAILPQNVDIQQWNCRHILERS
jgi:hypothetical protein